MFFEFSKDTSQETIGSQHLRGLNVQQLDVAFERNGSHQTVRFFIVSNDSTDGSRVIGILHSYWDIILHCRLHGNRVQHLCPEVGQFTGFVVRDIINGDGIGHQTRVRTQDTIDILPNLDFINLERSPELRSSQIRSSSTQGRNLSVWFVSNKTRHDSDNRRINLTKGFANGVLRLWQQLGVAKCGICEDTNIPSIKSLCRDANLVETSRHDANRTPFSVRDQLVQRLW
mmetsp:Transcript_13721/g.27568  ORF Transcript_13721/g.27568 Transcript_13721/m.27568 type:complete len:229 (+) Transcript_13721:464-1150(+)